MNLIIKKDQVQFATDKQRRPAPSQTKHKRQAQLIMAGGEPRAIEVCCDCGEQFVIELDFEEDAQ